MAEYTSPQRDQINLVMIDGYGPPPRSQINIDMAGATVDLITVDAEAFRIYNPTLTATVGFVHFASTFNAHPVLLSAPSILVGATVFAAMPNFTGDGYSGVRAPAFEGASYLTIGEVYSLEPGVVYVSPFTGSTKITLGSLSLGVVAPMFIATGVLAYYDNFPTEILVEPFVVYPRLASNPWSNTDWLEFARSQGSNAAKLYFCVITGADNNISDVKVPITSFQSRRRSGTPSYLQAVVPGTSYYDAISARPDGDLIIKMAYVIDGVISYQEEIARVNVGSINIYKGGRKQSVTISGHKQTTYASHKETTLLNIITTSFVSGSRRVDLAVPDLYLNPGDTVLVDGESFVADLITTTVSVMGNGRVSSTMTISER